MEVMVSAAVLGVIMFYLTDMLVQQSRTYAVVDDVHEAQQNLRAVADLLEREVRSTGMLVREGGAICGIDNGAGGSDLLFVTDADVMDPTDVTEAGLGLEIETGYNNTAATSTMQLDGRALEPDANDVMYDNSSPLNGTADSDFFWPGAGIGGGIIVTDKNNPDRGVRCGVLTDVRPAGVGDTRVIVDWTVTIGGTPYSPNPGLGALLPGMAVQSLIAIPAHAYLIDRSVPQRPRLWRDGVILADDVEDLQVAYFHDANANSTIDLGEWSGDTAASPYNPDLLDNLELRAIRFNLVVRTAEQDPDVAQDPSLAFGVVQPTENSAVVAGPADGYRRRIYSRTIRPRNVGLRGAATATSL
jgi:hypothetical protein